METLKSLCSNNIPSSVPEKKIARDSQLAEPKDKLNFAKYILQGDGLKSTASLIPDGRIAVSIDVKEKELSDFQDNPRVEEFAVDKKAWSDVPSMSIVIMIVGSRGDVQPYVALGKELVKDGHRVRIATHETFRELVTAAGLELYNIGGNPQDLMSYMVKNPGLIPGFGTLISGDIRKKRKMLSQMITGCWQACFTPDQVSGRNFTADAIISNPPAFAHIHCAEALSIPLQLSFTMPWTHTTAFPQPLVTVTCSNTNRGLSNYLSYGASDFLTWQGVGDIINAFRNSVGLSSLSILSGPSIVDRLEIPWAYCMSPALVPKPDDWKDNIDVVGYYFLDLASAYTPSPELDAFLKAGDPPVYVGFGSVIVDDPAEVSKTIFEATKQAGVRALVSAGWGGLGGVSVPPHVFMLGNVPHDWLFDNERVAAVVHHGGAGTAAIGLTKGRPTVVVPFFGDQGFWGYMIYKAGAGPKPIPYKELTVKRLAEGIKFAINPSAKAAARRISEQIANEHGVRKGIDSFYQHLPLLNMRCNLDPKKVGVWWSAEHCLKLSAFAAQTLADENLLNMDLLYLHRPREYKHADAKPMCTSCRVSWCDRFHGTSRSTQTKTAAATNSKPSMKSPPSSPTKSPTKRSFKSSHSRSSSTNSSESESPAERIMGAAKNFIQGKIPSFGSSPTRPSSPPARMECKTHELQLRTYRIAEGKEAVGVSTVADRQRIVQKFRLETHQVVTLKRMKTYDNMVKHSAPSAQFLSQPIATSITIEEPQALDKIPLVEDAPLSPVSPPADSLDITFPVPHFQPEADVTTHTIGQTSLTSYQ